jgi:GNAT superfamily N-acetyltransferase
MRYLTEPLDSKHDRQRFFCGENLLDIYIRQQAKQDVKRKLSACFVLVDKDTKRISGYYTLSSNCITSEFIPDSFRKILPNSYSSIPTILIGRLAIDADFQGKGVGKILLIDSLKRCYDTSDSIGAFAVIVDPFDNDAERFYAKYGFIKLPESGKMFLPMKTISQLFE